jgi:hypothetical protein
MSLINRGTGAGGAKTNHNGLAFESLTNSEPLLVKQCFTKKIMSKNKTGYYYEKTCNIKKKKEKEDEKDKEDEKEDVKDKEDEKDEKDIDMVTIFYLKQAGFKEYINNEFNILVYRNPDEAFIIKTKDTYYIKIIEKKNQNVNGSVEDKLKTGQFNREEYEMMFDVEEVRKKLGEVKIKIDYSFCVSEFLAKKLESSEQKYVNIKKINQKHNINIFYGNQTDYFEKIFEWIKLIE